MPHDLKVLAFNCTLKSARDKEKSSTQVLIEQLMDALKEYGANGDIIRVLTPAEQQGDEAVMAHHKERGEAAGTDTVGKTKKKSKQQAQ